MAADPETIALAQRYALARGRSRLSAMREVIAILARGGCSTRAIAKFLSDNGCPVGKSSVSRYLREAEAAGLLEVTEPPPPTAAAVGSTRAASPTQPKYHVAPPGDVSGKPFRTRPPIPGRDSNL